MLPYYGGKSKQAQMIIQMFPSDYTKRTYVEVFGGAGWVLFTKKPSTIEIYNDINGDLVHLFRTLRDDLDNFIQRYQWVLHSREMYNEAKRKLKNRNFKDNIDRAIATAVVIIQSFNHTLNPSGWSAKQLGRAMNILEKFIYIHNRLKNVSIENLDWKDCIENYDDNNTIFYIDPPYIDCEDEYGVSDWNKETHIKLAQTLKNCKAKWALSYYDHPLIRELYKDYNIIEYKLTVSNGIHTVRPRRTELLILNYKPPHKTSFL